MKARKKVFDMLELCKEIAKHLDGTWTVGFGGPQYVELKCNELGFNGGPVIRLVLLSNNKIEITPIWPAFQGYVFIPKKTVVKTLRVSSMREGASIARDINELLPSLRIAYHECLEQNKIGNC